MSHSAELLVLGGGPAGLAAAWRAARAGRSVLLLERARAPGGMAAGFEVAGIRVDHGSHRLQPGVRADILADLAALLGDELQLRSRNGRLRIGGRWIDFPLRASEVARTLPTSLLARITRDALTSSFRGYDVPRSYADRLRVGLGPALYDELYGPLATKLWGLPGEELDAEQARSRVSADAPWKIGAGMLRRRSGPGRVYHYPRPGFGRLVEVLAAQAVAAGAQIRLSTPVHGIEPGAEAVLVHTGDGSFSGARLFSTVPLPRLAAMIRPAAPAPVAAAASGLGFRGVVLIYVVHEGRPWTPYDAHHLPGPETPITRISEPTNYRDNPADPADRTVLCCELPCAPGDHWWRASEAELAELVVDTLARTGLPPPRLAGVEVRRSATAYPILRTGYSAALRTLDDWLAGLPRVTTFGRQGLFVHDNTHHALAMAYDAVDALRPGGGFDESAWAAARDRFTEHVVDD